MARKRSEKPFTRAGKTRPPCQGRSCRVFAEPRPARAQRPCGPRADGRESVLDTKEVRSADSRAYALLNDSEQAVSPAVLDALRSYDVRPVPWSQREGVREELAA